MTHNILFLPQNDTHARTVLALVPQLRTSNVGSRWLDLDDVFRQGVRDLLGDIPAVESGLATEVPFYRSGPRHQIPIVIAARRRARRWLSGVHGVVAFNDGAIQRVVLGAARRSGLRTDLLLDGMITRSTLPMTISGTVKRAVRALGRALEPSGLDTFLPSEVGLSSVDRIFVAGEHSATVLRERGARAARIVASGLPRWSDLRYPPSSRIRRVLYLTGAFGWHGDQATARSQVEDVRELHRACGQLGLEVSVRVHPRDDARSYLDAGIMIDDPNRSFEAAVEKADLVLSIVSTGLVEAVLMGRLARSYATGAGWERYRSSFSGGDVFQPITTWISLAEALQRYRERVDPDELRRQQVGIHDLVAARGAEATRTIATALAV